MTAERPRQFRCAIYTRKSSEEGLEQDFNSLDAQREACLAYIESQRHEGWRAVPTAYDDGGFSGGSMERPALKALLEDIEVGRVDVVVVYKVDRLTRSLSDFAQIVDIFDRRGASFVSITQQFNTTTSMGRLTLNVLLSFAQFEREVTGERIRDKIAASRRKGMWMGGFVPIGYEARDKKLVEDPAGADLVRRIFERYAALGCVARLKAELDLEGIISTPRQTPTGRRLGGQQFSRGALYKILNNRVYIGEAVHKGKIYPGEHQGIVPKNLWDRVQKMLSDNAATQRSGSNAKEPSLLAGLVFDERGNHLSPAHTVKDGRRYRYYVSQAVLQYRDGEAGSVTRIPAHDLEAAVSDRLHAFLKAPSALMDCVCQTDDNAPTHRALLDAARERAEAWPELQPSEKRTFVRAVMVRATVEQETIVLTLSRQGLRGALLEAATSDRPEARQRKNDQADRIEIRIQASLKRRGRETKLVIPPALPAGEKANSDPALIRALVRAHTWKERLFADEKVSIRSIAMEEKLSESYVSRITRLAFLAPDIVEAILEGRQPSGVNLDRLRGAFPTGWQEQRMDLSLRN